MNATTTQTLLGRNGALAGPAVTVGIVGLGLASTAHIRGYQTHPQAKVLAVCDVDRVRAEAFAQEHAIAKVYTDFAAMLADPAINTIDIATPTYLLTHLTQITDDSPPLPPPQIGLSVRRSIGVCANRNEPSCKRPLRPMRVGLRLGSFPS